MSSPFEVKPDAPSDTDVSGAYNTIIHKVMAMLHDRAERIVADVINGSYQPFNSKIATASDLNDRIVFDIEGKEDAFGAPCTPDEILFVLSDEIPDDEREIPTQGSGAIELIQGMALRAYYCGIYTVLRARFGMTDIDGPIFDAGAPAGIVEEDAVPSILRHEIERGRGLASQIMGG